MISRVKGTQDFLDMTLYSFVVDSIADYLTRYNFTQIATPILEHTELFMRSLGQETDVVSKEMFTIYSEKHNAALCLRPEFTAATMRAYLENGIDTKPWKVFSIGPAFRHERPQKGRYRQFHQASIEIMGTTSVHDDVQLITMLDRLFTEQFKLDNYALVINYLGDRVDRERFKKALYDYLSQHQSSICDTCVVRKEQNILRVFDCKNPTCQELYANAPELVDYLGEDTKKEWELLQNQLHMLSVSYTYNPRLVRGLDYYGKTVFEFVSGNLGAQNAFCGGGRYEQLATELGSKTDVPSVGAAMGIERIMLLLEPIMDSLALPAQKPLQLILPMDEEQKTMALLLADAMRAHGLTADVLFEGSLKSRMRRTNKMGAQHVLIIGSDEQAAGEVTIKNMQAGTEERVKQVDVVNYLKK